MNTKRTRLFIALAFSVFLGTGGVLAQITTADDNASNYATWTGNAGSGYEAWTFTSNADGGFAGTFLETNANSASPNVSTSNKSFGTFANGGTFPTVAIFRNFEAGFEVGNTFTIDIQHGGIAPGGSVGFTLRSGTSSSSPSDYNNNSRFEFGFVGGDSNYSIFADGTTDTGIGFTSDGIRIAVTLTDINTVDVDVTTLSDDNTTTFSDISLGGTSSSYLLSLCLYNRDANDANAYFNSPSLSSSGNLSITGTEGWRMLSTPTSDNTYDDLLGDIWTQGIGTGADVTNGTASVQLYNTTTDNFAAATDLGATMTTGVGFITYVYSDDDYTNSGADAGFPKTLSLSGTENSGSVSPTLNTEGDAFTLVGNPYASTIDWDLLTRSDVTGTVYVYDNSDPGYISWNGTTGDLTDGLIATYQGFWVQNTSGSPTPSLTIEEADQSSGGTFYKDTAPTTIEFAAEMGELTGNAFFSFTNTGELGKDNYDGLRLEPLDFKEYLAVSTVVGEEQLSINNLPADLNQEVILPMDVEAFTTTQEGWTPKAGEITLSWPELNNLPENWEITLTDYQTGITTNILTQNSYTFTAEEVKGKVKPKTMFSVLSPVSMTKAKSADDASRFGITIAPNTSVSNEPDTKPTAFALNQNYPNPFNPSTTISYSVGQTGPVNITVYNVMGQKVAELVNA
ncbi:MAG: hypothetical protein ABJK11_11495, partial [Balneola sp.]